MTPYLLLIEFQHFFVSFSLFISVRWRINKLLCIIIVSYAAQNLILILLMIIIIIVKINDLLMSIELSRHIYILILSLDMTRQPHVHS